jgi:hypothetical protein
MGTGAEDAGEMQDDEQHDENDHDDNPKHHPALCAGGRSAVGPLAGFIAGVGVGRRVSDVRPPVSRVVAGLRKAAVTRQSVYI